jgi:GNAT superfamily N-acetyltransferase
VHETIEYTLPADEIYRTDTLSVFELRGKCHKQACQCLALFGKLFLNEKRQVYDVEGLSFYVLCEVREGRMRTVGYFSRLLGDESLLSSIVIFPLYQRCGFGKTLMALSYCIARRRGWTRIDPISAMGRLAFQSYWRHVVLNMEDVNVNVNVNVKAPVEELADETAIDEEDIGNTLKSLKLAKKVMNRWEISISRKQLKKIGEICVSRTIWDGFDPTRMIWMPGSEDEGE